MLANDGVQQNEYAKELGQYFYDIATKANLEMPHGDVRKLVGLAVAVDGALIIDGNRGDPSYTLSLIGRDIPNDDDLAISLQSNGKWIVLGAAKEVFISQERQAIKELMVLHPNGLKPSEVVELTGKKASTVRKLMRHMAGDGQLVNLKGTYSLPTLASSIGNSS